MRISIKVTAREQKNRPDLYQRLLLLRKATGPYKRVMSEPGCQIREAPVRRFRGFPQLGGKQPSYLPDRTAAFDPPETIVGEIFHACLFSLGAEALAIRAAGIPGFADALRQTE
jgi:hypothetical protein